MVSFEPGLTLVNVNQINYEPKLKAMKKNYLFFAIMITSIANAQYFEDFEKGVPGTMIQKFQKGETNFIDFSMAAIGVENALSEMNSAIFTNEMSYETTTTFLETPVLDLSSNDFVLEFKHLQKSKSDNTTNELTVELSDDLGKTWKILAIYSKPNLESKIESIDLSAHFSKNTIIRFKAKLQQGNNSIVLDDIAVQKIPKRNNKITNTTIKEEQDKTIIFPNPSTGIIFINSFLPTNIIVFDFNGRNIMELESNSLETTINLSDFQKGIYLIQTTSKLKTETKKILIK